MKKIKLDYSVVILPHNNRNKILIAGYQFKNGKICAHDLEGKFYELDADLGGFNSKTGVGWLDYFLGNERLKCLCEDENVKQFMCGKNLKLNDLIDINLLQEFETVINSSTFAINQ